MEKQVLVVGAGPTGLMMAAELIRHGVSVKIIDKKPEPTKTTNAAGIHARTLILLAQLNLIDRFLEEGIAARALEVTVDRVPLTTIPLDAIDSRFNYILMLSQAKTEHILIEYLASLGCQVDRAVEFIVLTQTDDRVISKLKHEDGTEETVETDWVIGCDGYHSAVRDQAGIALTGNDYDQEFIVADARIRTNASRHAVSLYIAQGRFIGLFPLRDAVHDDVFRIVASVSTHEVKKSFTDEEVQDIVQQNTSGLADVISIEYNSPFWIHSKIATHLQQNRVFIAGDAAHVHSPAGAQGMNTGLQDAYNLAWKLALVVNKQANPAILVSYQAERYPIMQKVVSVTDKLPRIALSQNAIVPVIRNFFIKYIVGQLKYLQRKALGYLAQLSWRYKKSPIIDYDGNENLFNVKPGNLALDVRLSERNYLLDNFRHPKHNLLIFSGKAATVEELQKVEEAYQRAQKEFPTYLKPFVVSNQTVASDQVIADPDNAIHDRYGVDKPALCLVRPDEYIGMFRDGLLIEAVAEYFKKLNSSVLGIELE